MSGYSLDRGVRRAPCTMLPPRIADEPAAANPAKPHEPHPCWMFECQFPSPANESRSAVQQVNWLVLIQKARFRRLIPAVRTTPPGAATLTDTHPRHAPGDVPQSKPSEIHPTPPRRYKRMSPLPRCRLTRLYDRSGR